MINNQIGKQIKIKDCRIEQIGDCTSVTQNIILAQAEQINNAIEEEIVKIATETETVTDVIVIDKGKVKEMVGKYCIPFKPFTNTVEKSVGYVCKCGNVLMTTYESERFRGEKTNYCKNCGQLLDWEADED